jgi:NDP-sugar pyrophosphorylase family protein
MEEYKVLLTTSGLGSRLGNLTKFTNKSLVRLGDKPVISHIIETYPKGTEFIVTLGHYGSHVKQYLNIAHPESDITFVDVDNYMGEGSSLLYSISLCEEHLNQPFIFHACDTLLSEDYVSKINFSTNWSIGCLGKNSQSYRTINSLHNDKISSINEKGESNYNYVYVGVSGIKDYESFWKEVGKILSKTNSSSLSDCHVIRNMLDYSEFKVLNVNGWHDIGNIDALREAKDKIKSSIHVLDKEDENIFLVGDYVIKFFHNGKICNDRVLRTKSLGNLVPRVVDSSENFYKYEYFDGELLSKKMNPQRFKNLLEWSSENLWIPKEDSNYRENCLKFYKEKTLIRIQKLLQKYNIKDSSDIINGVKVPPIKEMIESIDFDSIMGNSPKGFHGDFILDNILYNDGFKLIDWRQDFNGNVESGDMNYDLAKLNHNLVLTHQVLSKELFTIDTKNDIECDVYVKKSLIDCKEILIDFCDRNDIDFKSIEILSSIVWINMSPLHEHPLDIFLYYFGKYNLFLNMK